MTLADQAAVAAFLTARFADAVTLLQQTGVGGGGAAAYAASAAPAAVAELNGRLGTSYGDTDLPGVILEWVKARSAYYLLRDAYRTLPEPDWVPVQEWRQQTDEQMEAWATGTLALPGTSGTGGIAVASEPRRFTTDPAAGPMPGADGRVNLRSLF